MSPTYRQGSYRHVHGAGARGAVGRYRGVADHCYPRRRVRAEVDRVAPVKPVPVIVTRVSPGAGPLVGLIPVTVGAAAAIPRVSTTSSPSPP